MTADVVPGSSMPAEKTGINKSALPRERKAVKGEIIYFSNVQN